MLSTDRRGSIARRWPKGACLTALREAALSLDLEPAFTEAAHVALGREPSASVMASHLDSSRSNANRSTIRPSVPSDRDDPSLPDVRSERAHEGEGEDADRARRGSASASVSVSESDSGPDPDRPWTDPALLEELSVEGDLTDEQLADLLGCSRETVRSWLDRFELTGDE